MLRRSLAPLSVSLFKQYRLPEKLCTRLLSLQEYQSKKLLEENGLTAQRFGVANTPDQALQIAKDLNVKEYVIKAQIMAGGKGKGRFEHGYKGGVQVTKDLGKIKEIATNMLGHRLITKQTTADGVLVQKITVVVSEVVSKPLPVMVGSPCGGVDIEEVARSQPDKIFKEPIDPKIGCTDEQALRMADNLEFLGDKRQQAADIVKGLYNVMRRYDATQIEINPLAETTDGQVLCFDCKLSVDDNADYRQRQIFDNRDLSETDPREIQAAKSQLNYIGLDGNIACLVNGAGLAMATMDIIKLHGGEPANFLDVGGSVTQTQVENAFKLLTSDQRVKAILVNIFGGIVNCLTIADGIVAACRTVNVNVPLIVRLEGTNVDAAKRVLNESGLAITSASDLGDAARKAVQSLGSS